MEARENKLLSFKTLAFRLVFLSGIILGGAALLTAIGVLFFKTGTWEPLIAFVTCLVSAILAHIAGEYPKGDLYVAARMGVQVAVRTVLPLVVVVFGLYFVEPPLEKSLVFYMILFYLIGLVADVQLSLVRLKEETKPIPE